MDRDRLSLDRERFTSDNSLARDELGLRRELGQGELGLSRERFGFDQTNAAANRQQQTDMQGRDLEVERERNRAQSLMGLFQALGMNPDIDVDMLMRLFDPSYQGGTGTGTPSASSTTATSRPGLVSENVTSRTRESSFKRRSTSASASPYLAAKALSPASVGCAAVRSSDRLAAQASAEDIRAFVADVERHLQRTAGWCAAWLRTLRGFQCATFIEAATDSMRKAGIQPE